MMAAIRILSSVKNPAVPSTHNVALPTKMHSPASKFADDLRSSLSGRIGLQHFVLDFKFMRCA